MSEASEIWACHFKTTCGWRGPKSAIGYKPHPGSFGERSACPRCGQTSRGFSVVKAVAAELVEAESRRQERLTTALSTLTQPAAKKMAHYLSASMPRASIFWDADEAWVEFSEEHWAVTVHDMPTTKPKNE